MENAPPLGKNESDPVILLRVVTSGYLEAMGMTLRSGRTFIAQDGRVPEAGVAIVNETFARRFWPRADGSVKRIRHRGAKNWWIVVGVLADVKDYGLDQEVRPSVYLPLPQMSLGRLAMVMRTAGNDPLSLVAPSREVLRQVDPDLAMLRPTSMAIRLSDSMWIRRTYSWLVAAFAGIAIILVISGLYGVISYTVSQRGHELAIRMALGAKPRQVLGEVLGQGLVVACIGLVLGMGGGLWTSRLLSTLLYGVTPTDKETYAASMLGLLVVAMLASLAPAIRAARTDPMRALRLE